jgi:hypothetical protein
VRLLFALFAFCAIHGPALSQPDSGAPQPAASQPLQVVAASNSDKDWQPTDLQRERVVRDTFAYFAARDERRFEDAYSRFAASQKAVVSFDRWVMHMENFYGKAGAVQARTVRKVTWYKNPGNAQPGIYAAVDFASQFPELALHCGFVAWRQQMDGSFELVREEENSIPKAEMAKLTPETLSNIRAQFRC